MNASSNTNFGPSTTTNTNALTGGAKRKVSSKKLVSKQNKQQKASKSSKQDLKSKQNKQEKKGGSFVADVNNLAVPFAILLAKEGLSKVFKKDAKDTKKTSTVSAKTASKPSSLRRRSTLAGGSCNLGCGAMTGGRAAHQLLSLQREIDNFLEKY